MSDSPFSTFTLWQYRNLAVGGLCSGAFFVAVGGSGFKGGLNMGLGLALIASAIYFVWARRFVQRRLDWPIEYWRQYQRRVSGRFWGAVCLGTCIGLVTTLVALFTGAFWISGLATGLVLLPTTLVVAKLGGQIGSI